jgi:TatD DNase family protein
MQSLIEFADRHSKRITALGEFGLDYDRFNYCAKEVQLKYFEAQLTALARFKLPLFLHSRACKDDFLGTFVITS